MVFIKSCLLEILSLWIVVSTSTTIEDSIFDYNFKAKEDPRCYNSCYQPFCKADCTGHESESKCSGESCIARTRGDFSKTLCQGFNCTSRYIFKFIQYRSFVYYCSFASEGCYEWDCSAECNGTNCSAECEGPTCKGFSKGHHTNSLCVGSGCHSTCAGHNCTSKSSKLTSKALCFGNYCSCECSGDKCTTMCFGNGCTSNCIGNECNAMCIGLNCETSGPEGQKPSLANLVGSVHHADRYKPEPLLKITMKANFE